MIVVPALKVGFQGVPKVGTTAIYLWMFDLCALVDGKHLQGVTRGREYFVRGRGGNLSVVNEEEAIEPYEDYYCFAFYRDPIKRFVSMYRNRVVYHRELAPTAKAAPLLEANGLPFNPQPNELVARLEEYMASAKSIDHHSRPQIDFIGPDKSVYTRLVDLKAMSQVLEELRGHWQKNGMTTLATSELVPGREQTGGPKLGLEALSEESFEKLVRFYRADYQAFSGLSVDAIRAEHREALAGQPATKPVIFWANRSNEGKDAAPVPAGTAEPQDSASGSAPLQLSPLTPTQARMARTRTAQAHGATAESNPAKPQEVARTVGPSTGSPAAATTKVVVDRPKLQAGSPQVAASVAVKGKGKVSGKVKSPGQDKGPGLKLRFQKQDVSAIALLRADFPRAGTCAGDAFALGGQCMLAPDFDVTDYALQLRWPGHAKDCVWEIDSPGLAQEHPDNKNSQRARFKVTGVALQLGEQAELMLKRREGNDEQLIASLSLQEA